MSNFICSECGMSNIDCGGAGYKTPKEIELEQQVKRLRERLADADKAIKLMDEKYGEHYIIADGTKMGNSPAWKYMLKWGVK